MPYVPGQQQRNQPSCWDKMKFGFGIGFCVGLASGSLFGGFGALRAGLRGYELIQTTGKVAIQGGGTFGTFMAIGTGVLVAVEKNHATLTGVSQFVLRMLDCKTLSPSPLLNCEQGCRNTYCLADAIMKL